jgi:hypothetical protein
MCDYADSAGLVVKTVAELRKLGREHEENWSDAKMIEVYGDADRSFPSYDAAHDEGSKNG